MGIQVADFEFDSMSVTLPLAYVAFAQNTLTLDPRGAGVYRLYTQYSIWSSYEARQAQKAPVENRILDFVTPDETTSLTDVYTLAYDELKAKYPNYVDKQD